MRSWAAEAVLLAFCTAALGAERLPGQGADSTKFTVSGLSSGGYMAVQLQVAHSSRVGGVGALAAGPYYCAQGSLWTAWSSCMSGSPVATKAHAERYARDKLIDPTANLASARVWLFSGTRDRTVETPVVDALAAFYAAFGAKPVLIKDKPAGHAMVTQNAGSACGTTEPPFINDCDYDAAGELLHQLLGNLSSPSKNPGGRMVAFDQREFGDAYAISMADDGYAYIPAACATQSCKVHVAFHGCRQAGEAFVRDAGYNRWADTNRLIVLYPQAIARYWWVYNPRGCWDWWGYTGARYATKEGVQIKAVLAMVERLGQPRK